MTRYDLHPDQDTFADFMDEEEKENHNEDEENLPEVSNSTPEDKLSSREAKWRAIEDSSGLSRDQICRYLGVMDGFPATDRMKIGVIVMMMSGEFQKYGRDGGAPMYKAAQLVSVSPGGLSNAVNQWTKHYK